MLGAPILGGSAPLPKQCLGGVFDTAGVMRPRRLLSNPWKGRVMDMKKMLEDFHAAYNGAFNRGDADGCAAFFSEDVALLPPNQPMG